MSELENAAEAAIGNEEPRASSKQVTVEERTYYLFLLELLFLLMPIGVLLLFEIRNNSWENIFKIPEWAFGATLVTAQVLAKFTMSIASPSEKNIDVKVGCVSGLLIGYFLLCSTILFFVLDSNEVSSQLSWTQVILFIIAVFAFGVFSIFYERQNKSSILEQVDESS